MSYITYSDLDNEIVDLIEHVPTGKDASTWVQTMIDAAEAEVNGRLASLYRVPFDPVDDLIRTIALYFAASRILNPGFVAEVPADSKVVDTYYRRGDDLLKRLESGDLTIDAPSSVAAGELPASSTSSKDREMTMDTMEGW